MQINNKYRCNLDMLLGIKNYINILYSYLRAINSKI